MMKKLSGVIAATLVVLVAGCAGSAAVQQGVQQAAVPTSNEAQVAARAEARWKAMIAKDLDLAYTFLSPGSKAVNPIEVFKGKIKPLDWRAAKAGSVSCEQDKCQVKISLTFSDQRLGGEITTVLAETWLKDSDQWWLVFN
jgi:hypothetical protein